MLAVRRHQEVLAQAPEDFRSGHVRIVAIVVGADFMTTSHVACNVDKAEALSFVSL